MKTLLERVTEWMDVQAWKHDLGEHYVENTVNTMTNMELLQAISEALEEMETDKAKDGS